MRLLGRAVSIVERNPLDYLEWLPPQHAYLHQRDKRVLLRAGNQALGKSTVGVADQAWWARGEHPYRPVPKRPVTGWIVSSSEQQSGQLARKLHDLLPPNWIHPETTFQDAKGHYRGKYPKVGIRSVHGGWSWLHFRWTGQHSLNLAGATLDGVLFDEPPANQRAFREVERRLTRTGGDMRMTFTPVNAPVDYIRDLVDDGQIVDLHYSLRAEHLIPIGRSAPLRTTDGRPMDAAWIAEQRRLVLEWEAPVILDGEWEFRAMGQVFPAWDPAAHVTRTKDIPEALLPRTHKLAIGIDYGDDSHRQVAILVAVDDAGEHPRVWVLDEYVSDGRTTTEQDAKEIVAMLQRQDLRWEQVDFAHGDKRYTGRRNDLTEKSNTETQKAIADLLRVGERKLSPPILSAKRGQRAGAGAKYRGARWLHEAMIRPGHFKVAGRCETLIESLGKWDWTENYKDPVDALRYALKPWILGGVRVARPVRVRVA